LHPGTRILIYLLSALAVPGLSLFQLLGLSLALGTACIGRLGRIWTLLRRARWLLLLMVITYGYSLPGDALFPGLAQLAPTREGLLQGLVQAWRLALLLLLLDVLVLRIPIPELLTGLHSVLRPLAWIGVDRDRVTVRLALTMQAMERPQGWAGIRGLLAGQVPAQSVPNAYVLAMHPYRPADWLVLGMLSLGVVWLYA
jgi:energy-coupling factor transporter transmembrane protein EcfT